MHHPISGRPASSPHWKPVSSVPKPMLSMGSLHPLTELQHDTSTPKQQKKIIHCASILRQPHPTWITEATVFRTGRRHISSRYFKVRLTIISLSSPAYLGTIASFQYHPRPGPPAIMSALRCMRPASAAIRTVPFQKATLPQCVRAYSTRNYEYIQVSQPKPGVGQGAPQPTPAFPPAAEMIRC